MSIVELHRYVSTAIDGTSVVLNLLLLYLILKCSPAYMKTYKFLILLSCIGDLALSVVSTFGQPVVAHDQEYAVVISNGFFSSRSALLDHIAMALYCVSLHANIVFIVVQFIWRYKFLSKDVIGDNAKEGVRRFRTGALFLIVPWSLAQAITACFCLTLILGNGGLLHPQLMDRLRNIGWHVDEAAPPFPSSFGTTTPTTTIHNVLYVLDIIIGYTIIIWCQLQSRRYLRCIGQSTHAITRRAHRDFNRALIVLALTPLASLVPAAIIFGSIAGSSALGFALPLQYSALLTIGMTNITLANPIATILLVAPYRRAVAGALGVKGSRPSTIQPTEPVGSYAQPAEQHPRATASAAVTG